LLEHYIWKGVEIVKDGMAAKLLNESNKVIGQAET